MAKLEITLFGAPEIHVDGAPIKTDRRKAIALLAYLALSETAHTRDHLAGLLWPDYSQESALAYLRRTVWELNKILGKGWIEADRDQVRINRGREIWVDAIEFERTLGHSDNSLFELNRVVELYRGGFLQGFSVADTRPFEEWQFRQEDHLRRDYAKALERLVEGYALAEEHENALPFAQQWVSLDVLNETAQRALMRVYSKMGDRTAAIRQYESCCKKLRDEFGIEPQAETTALYQAILRGQLEAVRREGVESQATTQMKPEPRLPLMPTPFIGRRTELEEIKGLISNPDLRLVTLIGPGGSGKTRLAIQAAGELVEFFPDGIFFAPLAPVLNPEAVLAEIAKALDFTFYRDQESPLQQLLEYLHNKKLLLVIDNFEHLLEAAPLATELIMNSEGVKVLVTSRVRLNVQGEQLYLVTGMHLPDEIETSTWDDPEQQAKPFSAVQLFLDRARRLIPSFELNQDNLSSVMEICRLVEGMPLGIELAAGWLALLTPQEIAVEIAESLDFLTTEQGDIAERQRSLRAVFDSSWKILSEKEREVFQKLCLFVGSFSREAAQQVGQASLETLLGLVNKSFLQNNHGRFQLHELMRQYGTERLKTDPAKWREAKDRHAAFFKDFMRRQERRLQSAEQSDAMAQLEKEFDSNILAAVEWLVEQERWQDLIESMLTGLFDYSWILDRLGSMISWLRKARMRLSNKASADEQLAYAILATFEVICEENEQLKDDRPLEKLSQIWRFVVQHQLEEKMGLWFILLAGMIESRNMDPTAGEKLEAVIEHIRKQNDPWKLGVALLVRATPSQYKYDEEKLLEAKGIFEALEVDFEQGNVAEYMGRQAVQKKKPPEEAFGYFQKAKYFYRKLPGYQRGWISFMYVTGLYFREGQFEEGFALHHETQAVIEKLGNRRLLAHSLHWEGLHATRYSTFEHALGLHRRSLELFTQLDNRTEMAWQTYEFGEIYRLMGDRKKAMEYYSRAHAMFERMDHLLGLSHYSRGMGDLAMERADFQAALRHYQDYQKFAEQDNHEWSTAQAYGKLAWALAHLGETERARKEMRTSLKMLLAWGEDDLVLMVLLAEAACLMQEGKQAEAVELAAFLQNYRISWKETRMRAEEMLKAATTELYEGSAAEAVERGKALKFEEVVSRVNL